MDPSNNNGGTNENEESNDMNLDFELEEMFQDAGEDNSNQQQNAQQQQQAQQSQAQPQPQPQQPPQPQQQQQQQQNPLANINMAAFIQQMDPAVMSQLGISAQDMMNMLSMVAAGGAGVTSASAATTTLTQASSAPSVAMSAQIPATLDDNQTSTMVVPVTTTTTAPSPQSQPMVSQTTDGAQHSQPSVPTTVASLSENQGLQSESSGASNRSQVTSTATVAPIPIVPVTSAINPDSLNLASGLDFVNKDPISRTTSNPSAPTVNAAISGNNPNQNSPIPRPKSSNVVSTDHQQQMKELASKLVSSVPASSDTTVVAPGVSSGTVVPAAETSSVIANVPVSVANQSAPASTLTTTTTTTTTPKGQRPSPLPSSAINVGENANIDVGNENQPPLKTPMSVLTSPTMSKMAEQTKAQAQAQPNSITNGQAPGTLQNTAQPSTTTTASRGDTSPQPDKKQQQSPVPRPALPKTLENPKNSIPSLLLSSGIHKNTEDIRDVIYSNKALGRPIGHASWSNQNILASSHWPYSTATSSKQHSLVIDSVVTHADNDDYNGSQDSYDIHGFQQHRRRQRLTQRNIDHYVQIVATESTRMLASQTKKVTSRPTPIHLHRLVSKSKKGSNTVVPELLPLGRLPISPPYKHQRWILEKIRQNSRSNKDNNNYNFPSNFLKSSSPGVPQEEPHQADGDAQILATKTPPNHSMLFEWSPDGKYIVTASHDHDTAKLDIIKCHESGNINQWESEFSASFGYPVIALKWINQSRFYSLISNTEECPPTTQSSTNSSKDSSNADVLGSQPFAASFSSHTVVSGINQTQPSISTLNNSNNSGSRGDATDAKFDYRGWASKNLEATRRSPNSGSQGPRNPYGKYAFITVTSNGLVTLFYTYNGEWKRQRTPLFWMEPTAEGTTTVDNGVDDKSRPMAPITHADISFMANNSFTLAVHRAGNRTWSGNDASGKIPSTRGWSDPVIEIYHVNCRLYLNYELLNYLSIGRIAVVRPSSMLIEDTMDFKSMDIENENEADNNDDKSSIKDLGSLSGTPVVTQIMLSPAINKPTQKIVKDKSLAGIYDTSMPLLTVVQSIRNPSKPSTDNNVDDSDRYTTIIETWEISKDQEKLRKQGKDGDESSSTITTTNTNTTVTEKDSSSEPAVTDILAGKTPEWALCGRIVHQGLVISLTPHNYDIQSALNGNKPQNVAKYLPIKILWSDGSVSNIIDPSKPELFNSEQNSGNSKTGGKMVTYSGAISMGGSVVYRLESRDTSKITLRVNWSHDYEESFVDSECKKYLLGARLAVRILNSQDTTDLVAQLAIQAIKEKHQVSSTSTNNTNNNGPSSSFGGVLPVEYSQTMVFNLQNCFEILAKVLEINSTSDPKSVLKLVEPCSSASLYMRSLIGAILEISTLSDAPSTITRNLMTFAHILGFNAVCASYLGGAELFYNSLSGNSSSGAGGQSIKHPPLPGSSIGAASSTQPNGSNDQASSVDGRPIEYSPELIYQYQTLCDMANYTVWAFDMLMSILKDVYLYFNTMIPSTISAKPETTAINLEPLYKLDLTNSTEGVNKIAANGMPTALALLVYRPFVKSVSIQLNLMESLYAHMTKQVKHLASNNNNNAANLDPRLRAMGSKMVNCWRPLGVLSLEPGKLPVEVGAIKNFFTEVEKILDKVPTNNSNSNNNNNNSNAGSGGTSNEIFGGRIELLATASLRHYASFAKTPNILHTILVPGTLIAFNRIILCPKYFAAMLNKSKASGASGGGITQALLGQLNQRALDEPEINFGKFLLPNSTPALRTLQPAGNTLHGIGDGFEIIYPSGCNGTDSSSTNNSSSSSIMNGDDGVVPNNRDSIGSNSNDANNAQLTDAIDSIGVCEEDVLYTVDDGGFLYYNYDGEVSNKRPGSINQIPQSQSPLPIPTIGEMAASSQNSASNNINGLSPKVKTGYVPPAISSPQEIQSLYKEENIPIDIQSQKYDAFYNGIVNSTFNSLFELSISTAKLEVNAVTGGHDNSMDVDDSEQTPAVLNNSNNGDPITEKPRLLTAKRKLDKLIYYDPALSSLGQQYQQHAFDIVRKSVIKPNSTINTSTSSTQTTNAADAKIRVCTRCGHTSAISAAANPASMTTTTTTGQGNNSTNDGVSTGGENNEAQDIQDIFHRYNWVCICGGNWVSICSN